MLKYEILDDYSTNYETEWSVISIKLRQTCYLMRKQIKMAKMDNIQFDEHRIILAVLENTECQFVKEDDMLDIVRERIDYYQQVGISKEVIDRELSRLNWSELASMEKVRESDVGSGYLELSKIVSSTIKILDSAMKHRDELGYKPVMDLSLLTMFVRDQLLISKNKLIMKNCNLVNDDFLGRIIEEILRYRPYRTT